MTAQLDPVTERLQALATALLAKRKEAIEGRAASGVERRWLEDEKAFDGLEMDTKQSMLDYATGEATRILSQEPRRSKVSINIIRGKCETTHGRFADKVMPVDDRNWGLKLTPVADVVKGLQNKEPITVSGQPVANQDGGQLTVADLARHEMDLAEDAMEAMESEIDDQLNESSFNGECRKVAADSVKGGTGVLKGPNVIKRVKKAWMPVSHGSKTVHVMQVVEEFRPSSKRVDYWNVYPDPNCGDDPQKGAYIWERDSVLPRDVRMLIGVPGYFESELISVLNEEPNRTVVVLNKSAQHQAKTNTVSKGSAYERWEYYGELNREDLEALGCDCSHDMKAKTLSACVVFINDRPVKVQLNTLDTGGLPYDFFQWTTVSGSCWGIGIPRMELWPSRVITAAWRATMDNMGDSSGANIIVGDGIQPDDDVFEVTGKKLWRAEADVDVSKQFAQFQLANNQKDLQAVIELALRFADLESSVPMLFQGEKGNLPETLGATNIMVDSSNVALHIRVKRWDDQITRPHLKRYYDWNMQYNPRPEIKGDFDVDPRGTSVLFMRDQQAPILAQLLSMKGNPDVDLYTDWKKTLEQLYRAHHLDVMKSEEEIQRLEEERKNQPPPKAPAVEAAQIREQGATQRQQVELAAEAKQNDADRQLQLVVAHSTEYIEQMKQQGASAETIAQLKGMLAATTMKLQVQKELSIADMTHGKDLALAGHMVDLHKHRTPVMQPPTEPVGRAQPGHAFQQ